MLASASPLCDLLLAGDRPGLLCIDWLCVYAPTLRVHCSELHWMALHCTALYCTVLYCTVLHQTGLHWPGCAVAGREAVVGYLLL